MQTTYIISSSTSALFVTDGDTAHVVLREIGSQLLGTSESNSPMLLEKSKPLTKAVSNNTPVILFSGNGKPAPTNYTSHASVPRAGEPIAGHITSAPVWGASRPPQ